MRKNTSFLSKNGKGQPHDQISSVSPLEARLSGLRVYAPAGSFPGGNQALTGGGDGVG